MDQVAEVGDIKINRKYQKQYAEYLKVKTEREEKISGLTAKIEEAKKEIDAAKIRLEDSVNSPCSKCNSYAVIPHNEKCKLKDASFVKEIDGDYKTVYQCDVCDEVQSVKISGANYCDECGNRSLVFLGRTSYETGRYKCEVCGYYEEYS